MFQLRSAVCTLMIAGSVVSSESAPQYVRELAKIHAEKYPGEPMRLVGPLSDSLAKNGR
jgi:hypothetical protein